MPLRIVLITRTGVFAEGVQRVQRGQLAVSVFVSHELIRAGRTYAVGDEVQFIERTR